MIVGESCYAKFLSVVPMKTHCHELETGCYGVVIKVNKSKITLSNTVVLAGLPSRPHHFMAVAHHVHVHIQLHTSALSLNRQNYWMEA